LIRLNAKKTNIVMPTDDDTEQQFDENPAESDQLSGQSDEQPAEQADQPEQQAEEQSAEGDQPAEQTEETPRDSDQPTDQVEEQPAESDQSAEQAAEPAAAEDQATEPSEEQPAEGDQPAEQVEEQPAESDQPATAATADETVAFAGGGVASPGGSTGSGSATKPNTKKAQVIAIFMTDSASSRFRGGSITMNVFDGAKGNLLWKLGSMDQQKVTFQDAAVKSNIITSAVFSGVTGDNVKVELKVRMLGPESEIDPQHYSQVNFGTAARFEVPTDGTLKVAVDVETTSKEFTVGAKDEQSARDAAFKMLTSIEEIHLARVDSAVDVGAGQFRVLFRIPTKRIRILQPRPLEVIY
jgi:chemotaxis protein histidine kinase CheA